MRVFRSGKLAHRANTGLSPLSCGFKLSYEGVEGCFEVFLDFVSEEPLDGFGEEASDGYGAADFGTFGEGFDLVGEDEPD